MQNPKIQADIQKNLLMPNAIDASHLQSILDQSIRFGSDYADIFLQMNFSESWQLDQGQLRHGRFEEDAGFGLRAIAGERTAFAYSDGCSLQQLDNAVQVVKQMGSQGQERVIQLPGESFQLSQQLYQSVNPLLSLTVDQKHAYLQLIDQVIRKKDPRVVDVQCSLSSDYEVMYVMNQAGHQAQDIRPLSSLHVRVVIANQGKRAVGRVALGGRCDYQTLLNDFDAEALATKALHQASMNLEAAPPPGGVMPVVLGAGWPAVLLHEAIGHGLEGDHIRRDASVFAKAKGDKVASDQCTIVDDATIVGARGSLHVDDEGQPGQRTVLIEKGVVKGFMQDQHNASLMGESSTGNARRESYAHRPLVRMTNTFMLPGQYTPEEIIASVDKGIYCVDFSGGEVDITSGQFVFSTSEAYLIENGKITTPISATTLVGDGLSVLKQVSMVGNDLALDSGQGVCGKDGQSVAVGVGQPTLRVDGLMVGGVG
jgi:TldD protein